MNGVIIAKEEIESGEEDFEESPSRIPLRRQNSSRMRRKQEKRQKGNNESQRKAAKVKLWLRKVGHQVTLSDRQPESNNLITSVMLMPAVNVTPRAVSPNEDLKEEENEVEEAVQFEEPPAYTFSRHAIRSTYMDKSIEAKKKVIRMLFVVVAEFFVCWAPLHVLNTWYLFSPEVIYQYVGSTGVSLVQLLAYISSCCNPITYCFMNKKFRQAFLNVFHSYRLCSLRKNKKEGILRLETIKGGNNSIVYEGRIANAGNRSEIVELESEDHV